MNTNFLLVLYFCEINLSVLLLLFFFKPIICIKILQANIYERKQNFRCNFMHLNEFCINAYCLSLYIFFRGEGGGGVTNCKVGHIIDSNCKKKKSWSYKPHIVLTSLKVFFYLFKCLWWYYDESYILF